MKQLKLDFGKPDAVLNKQIDEAVVNFLAEIGTAFSVANHPSFKKLMNVAIGRVIGRVKFLFS